MTTRRRRSASADLAATPDLDARIAAAEASAVVIWQGRRFSAANLPERVAATSGRAERNALFASFLEAVEALNPLRAERLAARTAAATAVEGGLVSVAAQTLGYDPIALAVEAARLLNASETVYFAALRRYLALIDIEQGDATVADLWHVLRGSGWTHWFEHRRLNVAIAAMGADAAPAAVGATDGDGRDRWHVARDRLAATAPDGPGRPVAERALGALVSDVDWLERELAVPSAEASALADFGAFVRLHSIRRDAALLAYELRLYRTDDAALQRAYFAGLQSLQTGVAVPDVLYLREVDEPFASARRLRAEIGAGAAAEALHGRIGQGWWRRDEGRAALRALAAADSPDDGVAQLGYDPNDWRPVLRQIRTQLIGEMSGYGGPNITTRAGTRKV